MKRRNELDIFADVLRIAKGGAKKTQIVYGANLNFSIIKRYLSKLIERDLLVSRDKIYCTTEFGLKFLEEYYNLTSMLDGEFLTIDNTGRGFLRARGGNRSVPKIESLAKRAIGGK